jgi:hypothetical protein
MHGPMNAKHILSVLPRECAWQVAEEYLAIKDKF